MNSNIENILNTSQSTIYLLHNIGDKKNKNYNTRKQINTSNGLLTFDGVYKNVYNNMDVLFARDVILFVMGDYVGLDNSFDKKMPPEEMCSWKDINEMIDAGCKFGWHSWSHRDLTKLSKEEIRDEISSPFPTEYLAYPYGKFNDLVIEVVKEAGYKYAFSAGKYGDGSRYQIRRKYL